MSLVLCEALKDELRGPEETDLVQFLEPPQVGQVMTIGGASRWTVVEVETYHQQDETVYLAFIHPEGAEVPDRSEWTVEELRAGFPNLSFDVQIHQDRVLGSGWSMDGVAPTGRLYGSRPTDHETLMERVPLPWVVGDVAVYRPPCEGAYTAVHICYCIPSALPDPAAV